MDYHFRAKMKTDSEMKFLQEYAVKFESYLKHITRTLENDFKDEEGAENLIATLNDRRKLGMRRCKELQTLNNYIELRILAPLTSEISDAINEALGSYDFGDYNEHVVAMEKSIIRSMNGQQVALDFRQQTLPGLTKSLWEFLNHGWKRLEDDSSFDDDEEAEFED